MSSSEKFGLRVPQSDVMKGLQRPTNSGVVPAALGDGLYVADASRILIIDDDRTIHELLKARLAASGFTTESAYDGKEGLQRIQEFNPDVVFLDVSMSGMNGLEVLERIRALACDVAVIMTAAHGSEEIAVEALRTGADDYLRKPFDRHDFRTVLDRTIDRLGLARHNTVLRRRLGVELSRAAEVQSGLLPRVPPQLAGIELAARCVPARHVGGDFYDWQQTPGLLSLTVGDVMGKGMPAAILMATVRAVLRAVGAHGSAAQSVQLAATALEDDLTHSGAFVTLFHAQLNLATNVLNFVDAGHGFVFLRRANGEVELLQPSGLPLGVLSNEVYEEGSIAVEAGDVLVVYSDGLLDARKDMFANPYALAAQIADLSGASAIAQRVIDLAVSEGPLPDDLTVAVLYHAPSADSASSVGSATVIARPPDSEKI